MKKIAIASICAVAFFAAEASAAGPRLFRRTVYKPAYQPVTQAAPVQYTSNNTVQYGSTSGVSAQDVANMMASRRQCAHFFQGQGAAIPYNYEGVGMASSQQAAYDQCCYSNSGRPVVDSGCAQGSDGYWYACKRYQ